MTTTTPATTPTIIIVDPRTLLVEANVRTDAALDPEFVDSVRDLGVLTPVLVHRTPDGLRVRAGQRRTLAAIEAGRDTIPALVLDGDDDQVQRIVEQWSENHHRRALSVADDAAAFEQLRLFGLSAAQIAKRTRAKKAHVTTALNVGASSLATSVAAKYDLTLDQAAVIAEFDDDPETVKALTVAAVKEPSRFAHIAQRARNDRAQAAAMATFVDGLTAQGVRVVTDEDTPLTRVLNLTDENGTALTEETHSTCPGHAARVRARWDGEPYLTPFGCTDPTAYGHREAAATITGTAPSTAEQAEQDEAQKAERRRVIENNKGVARRRDCPP
jgi:ParB family chromosome partitioning protein